MPLAIDDNVPMDEPGFAVFDGEVGAAMGLLNASSARLVATVASCIAGRWWEMQQTHCPEHWCKVRLGVSPATAARLVRCADGLAEFPRVAAAFAEGRLSLDHVDVIVTTAHPIYDRDLAESAPTWDIARMRRIIRNFSIPKDIDPPTPDKGDDATEPVVVELPADVIHAGWGNDGRYKGFFDLGSELGVLWEKTLGVARGALFTDHTGIDPDDDNRTREPTVIAPTDALRRLLHAALDGLDPDVAAGRRPGDRTQVVVHVDANHPERSRIHLGPLLPASVRRQLTCDADLRLALRRDGKVIALGRRRRTVDTLLRTMIEDRDGGCRVQGCGKQGFVHVHHLMHWEDGGPTAPDNLACLCPEHHRMVHSGRLKLIGDPERPDGLITLDRHGRPLPRPGDWPLPAERPTPPSPYRGTHWGQRAQYN